MSGGNSYFAQFLKDAKADYEWYSDTSTGSIPLSFEVIVEKQLEADIWLNPGSAKSIDDILKEDERYEIFKALQNKQVYNYLKKVNETGANAYWETGPVNPHLILSDLMAIFHPELFPDHELHYYIQLK